MAENEAHMEEMDKENSPGLVRVVRELKKSAGEDEAKGFVEANDRDVDGAGDEEIADWRAVRTQLEQLCGSFGKAASKHRSGFKHESSALYEIIIVC
ncbi:unnamed protein product [Heligmosomoides polygyrus]|uniref:Uncharacterized protein n=1 Tax=Heligmosomoides polygyrus TaxID=6339 RepID=A0A183F907_HELPZ|nr:unnamed protein product [Heligmosomoides polygyrus]